jgi:Zn-finger nucleic acid-binding protein
MRNCPHCRIPLILVDYEGFRIMSCGQCKGHLMYLSRLEPIKRITAKSQQELKDEAAADFKGDNTGKVKCSRCHAPMSKQDIRLPGLNLQIDVCRACSLIWLDGGELALAQLGHEAKGVFANAQELKRRMDEMEASPERKARFEEILARMPKENQEPDDFRSDIVEEVLMAIILKKLR